MKLIVGLGNPGQLYVQTRHNVGFMVVDHLRARWSTGDLGPWRSKHHSCIFECQRPSGKTILLKPMTYMNRSGQAVVAAASYFQIEPEQDLLVIVDDLDLPLGALRLRARGSPGSHKGLADIGNRLGTNNFARLRFGIDEPGLLTRTNFVLGRFTDEEQEVLTPALSRACDATECWAAEGIDTAMNQYNQRSKTARTHTKGEIRTNDDNDTDDPGKAVDGLDAQ